MYKHSSSRVSNFRQLFNRKSALTLKVFDWFYTTIIVEGSASQLRFLRIQIPFRMSVHVFFIDMVLESSAVSFKFYANKTAEIILSRESPRRFHGVGCCCFLSLDVFHFWTTFICH